MPQHTEEERRKNKGPGTGSRFAELERGVSGIVRGVKGLAKRIGPSGPVPGEGEFEEVLGAQGVPLVIPRERAETAEPVVAPRGVGLGRSKRVKAPPRPEVEVKPEGPGFSRIRTTGDTAPVPVAPAVAKEEAPPRFVDPATGGAIRRRDVIAPKEFRDLGVARENVLRELRFALSEGNRRKAESLTRQLTGITGQQRKIRTDIEKGITERGTKAGVIRQRGEAARLSAEEKTREREAEAKRFQTEEARKTATAASEIAARGVKARATLAGPRPKVEDFGTDEEFRAALATWQKQVGGATTAPPVGTRKPLSSFGG
jgi:hypothetical protein